MRYLWSVVALAGATSACGFEPEGKRAMEPPAIYRQWWQATERCAGRRGDFDRLRWYVVEGPAFPCPDGYCLGWWRRGHTIFLAGEWRHHELVVRHEMLHELLDDGDHPTDTFAARCHLTWESWHTARRRQREPQTREDRHALVTAARH